MQGYFSTVFNDWLNKMKNKTLRINFGLGADALSVQLNAQGFDFNPKRMKELTDHARSIAVMEFEGIMISKEADKCRNRLMKRIESHVKAVNGLVKSR